MNEIEEGFEKAEVADAQTRLLIDSECLEAPEPWAVEDFDDLWH